MSRRFWLALAAAVFAAAFAGCDSGGGAAAGDMVLGVTVRPGEVTVEQGESRRFEAEVYATGNATSDVTWSVSGNAPGHGTFINTATGVLSVASSEPPGLLTVTARSGFDGRRYGTALVPVVLASEPPVTVGISPATVMAGGRGTIEFEALVSVAGGLVEWFVSENSSDYTWIAPASADTLSALLIIGADETGNPYEDGSPVIVTARSVDFPYRYARARVLFAEPTPLQRMWIVGDMNRGPGGWLLPGAPMLPQAPGVFVWGGALERDAQFRFNPRGAVTWYEDWYAPDANYTPVILGGAVPMTSLSGGTGNSWIIPRAGWYTITADRNEMTVRVERTGSPAGDLDLWLVGSPGGWTLPGVPMTRESDYTFSWTGEMLANGNFRFSRIDRAADGWSGADWFASTGADNAPAPLAADVRMSVSGQNTWSVVEAGWYTITVNPDTLTMRVVRLEPPLENLWIVGAMTGWDSAGIPMASPAEGVFVWEGTVPASANFRFSRTQRGSGDWNSGSWFGTTPNNSPVVLGGEVPISVFVGSASYNNWMIPTAGGQYRITVDQFAMTLRVEAMQ